MIQPNYKIICRERNGYKGQKEKQGKSSKHARRLNIDKWRENGFFASSRPGKWVFIHLRGRWFAKKAETFLRVIKNKSNRPRTSGTRTLRLPGDAGNNSRGIDFFDEHLVLPLCRAFFRSTSYYHVKGARLAAKCKFRLAVSPASLRRSPLVFSLFSSMPWGVGNNGGWFNLDRSSSRSKIWVSKGVFASALQKHDIFVVSFVKKYLMPGFDARSPFKNYLLLFTLERKLRCPLWIPNVGASHEPSIHLIPSIIYNRRINTFTSKGVMKEITQPFIVAREKMPFMIFDTPKSFLVKFCWTNKITKKK